jgi:hypothetical protein
MRCGILPLLFSSSLTVCLEPHSLGTQLGGVCVASKKKYQPLIGWGGGHFLPCLSRDSRRFSGFDGLFAAFNFFPAVYFHFFEKVLAGGDCEWKHEPNGLIG